MSANPQKLAYIRTFGCQMNEHDSGRIRVMLAGQGFESTDTPKNADIILFNTCTIREKAHHKAMSEIGRAFVYKKDRPHIIIGVCGCVAQEEKESLFERYPHLDLMFGPDQIAKLPELIRDASSNGHAFALDLINDPDVYQFLDFDATRATSDERRATVLVRATAFVSIMKGCNCACSYCIVPKVRGREVCRPSEKIVEEVRALVSRGTKEVVLLGQNVNAYSSLVARRSSLEPKPSLVARHSSLVKNKNCSFSDLIRKIADETDIERIRFTSPHPKDVGGDLVREYAENKKLMPHIHLPLQAGSNDVLKKMRRGYTREKYLRIVSDLKKARPGISITTDLIAGFSGETRADFEDTLSLMREADFDSAFAFKYSPRPGTEAAKMFKDDVSDGEKEDRLREILDMQRRTSKRKNEALVGARFGALATGFDKMERGFITGRLPDNRIIHFTGNPSAIGNIVRLRVTLAHANSLEGEQIL